MPLVIFASGIGNIGQRRTLRKSRRCIEITQKMQNEIKEKKKAHNQIEFDCGVCGCKVRKCKWNRHVKSKKFILGVDGEK